MPGKHWSPNAKVASIGVGGPLGVLVLWALEALGVPDVTNERAAALVVLISALVAWLVSDERDREDPDA